MQINFKSIVQKKFSGTFFISLIRMLTKGKEGKGTSNTHANITYIMQRHNRGQL